MARVKHLIVFCYDVSAAKTRRKISAVLEENGARVQESVFECRMTIPVGEALLARLDRLREETDSVRMYVIPETGRLACASAGGAPIAEKSEFWLM